MIKVEFKERLQLRIEATIGKGTYNPKVTASS
jgi:hypothetical protein